MLEVLDVKPDWDGLDMSRGSTLDVGRRMLRMEGEEEDLRLEM